MIAMTYAEPAMIHRRSCGRGRRAVLVAAGLSGGAA
jgi:hypothetical protein